MYFGTDCFYVSISFRGHFEGVSLTLYSQCDWVFVVKCLKTVGTGCLDMAEVTTKLQSNTLSSMSVTCRGQTFPVNRLLVCHVPCEEIAIHCPYSPSHNPVV